MIRNGRGLPPAHGTAVPQGRRRPSICVELCWTISAWCSADFAPWPVCSHPLAGGGRTTEPGSTTSSGCVAGNCRTEEHRPRVRSPRGRRHVCLRTVELDHFPTSVALSETVSRLRRKSIRRTRRAAIPPKRSPCRRAVGPRRRTPPPRQPAAAPGPPRGTGAQYGPPGARDTGCAECAGCARRDRLRQSSTSVSAVWRSMSRNWPLYLQWPGDSG
jgi:hypothetical protein